MRLKPPPGALVDRFGQDVERTLGSPIAAGQRLALAVSGGPDSMAMLALAATAFPGRTIAATVDHGLRPESTTEAAMVADVCARIDVLHATLPITVPPGATGNLHAWARRERYLLLQRWSIAEQAQSLLTAHHGDDQAETFLMRAVRGSGVAGLAAVRASRAIEVPLRAASPDASGGFVVAYGTLTVLRPLLGWRRSELRAVAEATAMPFVDDPSNTEERFERARVRRWLEQADGIDALKIAGAAAHVAEAEADLAAVSRWLWSERALPTMPHEARLDVTGLPREVRRRLARSAIEMIRRAGGPNGTWDTSVNIEPLLDALNAGRGATQAGVMASARGDIWHFREAPPRRAP